MKLSDTKHIKTTFKKIRFKRMQMSPPGSAPGMISVSEGALKPVAHVYSYDDQQLNQADFSTIDEIHRHLLAHPSLTHWIEVKGFGDKQFLEGFTETFNIHRLEIEDVVNGNQRPKLEEADQHLFIVSRALCYNQEDDFHEDQVSIFIFRNMVISFQEKQNEHFNLVKERIRQNRGIIRKSGASYLGYALMDAIVDNYFPFMEKLGIFLDDLEDKLLEAPDQHSLQNIQASKRRLIGFRRIVWSERENVNDLLRTHTELMNETSIRYLRDTYDHTIQIMDMIDSYREITASLMDIYLSSVSNRLNQVMKVLTIISTIFIPLTFIVGVYGMNFTYYDDVSHKIMPLNMPELHSPYGYVGVILAMVIIVVLQIAYFFRKGWLTWRDRL